MLHHSLIKNPRIRRVYREIEKEARRRHKSPDYMWDLYLRQYVKYAQKILAERNGSGNTRTEVMPAKAKVRRGTDR